MTDTTRHPRRIPQTTLARAFSATMALTLAAPAVLAQGSSPPVRPPTPGTLEGAPTVLTIVVTVVLFALVMTAAVFPSKRGHQD